MYKKFFLLSIIITFIVFYYFQNVYGETSEVTGGDASRDQELEVNKDNNSVNITGNNKKDSKSDQVSSSKQALQEDKPGIEKSDDKKVSTEYPDKNIQSEREEVIEKKFVSDKEEDKRTIEEQKENKNLATKEEEIEKEEIAKKAKALLNKSVRVRAKKKKEYDDGLLELIEGDFKYNRIPGIAIHDIPDVEREIDQGGEIENKSSENGSGIFGFDKRTTDFGAWGIFLLIIAFIFLLFKFRSKGKQGTNVLRRFPRE